MNLRSRITSEQKWMNLLRHARIKNTKKTTNKLKTTTNYCGGIMGKSKQMAICAPSCSAVQFGGQDKPWTSVARAFVEQQHVFVSFKTSRQ
jgi:hypothetical protein